MLKISEGVERGGQSCKSFLDLVARATLQKRTLGRVKKIGEGVMEA